jgi:hypothetical protein
MRDLKICLKRCGFAETARAAAPGKAPWPRQGFSPVFQVPLAEGKSLGKTPAMSP